MYSPKWLMLVLVASAFNLALVACSEGEEEPLNSNSAGSDSSTFDVFHFVSEDFRVEFDYPAEWRPAPDDSGYVDPQGQSQGFFKVLTFGGEGMTLDEAAQIQAGHKLKPYGENPEVITLNLQAGEARLIRPNGDYEGIVDAELIIRYPSPLNVGVSPPSGSSKQIPVYHFSFCTPTKIT